MATRRWVVWWAWARTHSRVSASWRAPTASAWRPSARRSRASASALPPRSTALATTALSRWRGCSPSWTGRGAPMSAKPSTNGANGTRDSRGRFLPGHPGGPGNPFVKRVCELRSLLLGAVTDADMKAVVKRLIAEARKGEPWAVKELLDRLLGKPPQAMELSGPDGEALGGLTMPVLTSAILDALRNHPEARQSVARKLVELTSERPDGPGDGA